MELAVTKDDVASIAKKLDEFAAVLSEREQMIFMTMISLAGKAIAAAAKAGGAPTQKPHLPPLSQGFRNAFVPGGVTKFTLNQPETEGGSVTFGVTYNF